MLKRILQFTLLVKGFNDYVQYHYTIQMNVYLSERAVMDAWSLNPSKLSSVQKE